MKVYVSTITHNGKRTDIEYYQIGNIYRSAKEAAEALKNTVNLYIDLHDCEIIKEDYTDGYSYVCVANATDIYHLEIFPRELI